MLGPKIRKCRHPNTSSPYYVYLELEGNIEDDHRLVLQVSYCVDLTFEGYSSLKLQREIDHRIFVPCILPYKVPPPYLRKKSLVTLDHI